MEPKSKPQQEHQSNGLAKKSKLELLEPDAADVKQLVMDYLSHYTYISTAKALSSTSTSTSPSDRHIHGCRARHQSMTDNTAPTSSSFSLPRTLPPIADPGEPAGDSLMDSVVLTAPESERKGQGEGREEELAEAGGMAKDPDEDAVMGSEEAENEGANGASSSTNGRGKPLRADGVASIDGRDGVSEAARQMFDDLAAMEYRRDINHKVLQGDIPAALSLINLYFPTLFASSSVVAVALGTTPPPSSSNPTFLSATNSYSSSLASPTKPSQVNSKLVGPTGDELSGKNPPHRIPYSFCPPCPLPPTSLNPSHLYINLLLQSFIESIRSHPLPDPIANLPSLLPSSSSNGNGKNGTASHANGNGNSSSKSNPSFPTTSTTDPSSPSSSFLSTSSSTSSIASVSASLTLGQTLFRTIESLPNAAPEKEFYRAELIGVSSLLGYVPPERAPQKAYLEQERREALMEQVNSVLLVHSGHPPQPLLETLARQTTIIWERLAQHNIDPIPPWTRQHGVQWEKLAVYFRDHRKFTLSEFMSD